ncbi:hypothetical protein Tco_1050883, partial [Tanacetum coccineum]
MFCSSSSHSDNDVSPFKSNVGIKSFIRLFGITTALIKVSAAQEE